jgi:two-component system, NarL family, nitrate/nitrite response regulator NarL
MDRHGDQDIGRLPHILIASQEVRADERPEGPALRVVVADDHPLFRAGIVRALEEDDRFAVVGEAGDGETAEHMIFERNPDVALLDLRMPGLDGLQVLAGLRHHDPPVAVVVLTAYTHPSLVHSAMATGAAAYVAKDNDREEILKVLVDAATGRRRVLVEERVRDQQAPRPSLASRERIVLSMLNDGWSPEEIAMVGDMTPTTVNAHLVNARRKLGAVTTADAIAAAEAWGLLS